MQKLKAGTCPRAR